MKGLNSVKVEALLKQFGLNTITERKKSPFIFKFFEQFNNFLTILLIFAAIASFFIGEALDGALILIIVILNAIFGLYQEGKAEEALNLLKKMTVTKIRVVRDGNEQEIDAKFLVPGDMILIEAGVKVPADCKLIEASNLELNEASLTGESMPVIKKSKDQIFLGTIVTKGRGTAEVTLTGMKTKFGQIATSIDLITTSKTPLQKKMDGVTKMIGIIGIITSIFVFFFSLLKGDTYFPAFLLAISLAVAVVPEGLPAVMTITMAIGVKEMAKRKTIIRKLSAIEALGSITLIATDKTGTLTTNQMKVKEIHINNSILISSSSKDLSQLSNFEKAKYHYPNTPDFKGIRPIGSKKTSHLSVEMKLLLLDGILCSTASLVFVHDHGKHDVLGDPTEGALLFLAREHDLEYEEIRNEWRIVKEEPFDSTTKMMSVLVENKSNSLDFVSNFSPASTHLKESSASSFLFAKGAPESILDTSSKILLNGKEEDLTFKRKEEIEKVINGWAKKGLRVLAFAYRSYNPIRSVKNSRNNIDNCPANLTNLTSLIFLGMVAIHDPPRSEVLEAIKKTKQAGIKVVMITGDNEITAESVGASVGLIEEGDEILTGTQLDNYSDEELIEKLPKVKIFARTTPFHKSRIVKLFQKTGEIVAVTGDGVNDAIALKQADIGIAMGLIGTDVARETADMVITDDNFATIVNAVEEGRNIIKNLRNAIKYLLSCNLSEAASLVIGLFLGIPNLFYAIQLLYINLVTDGLPALALSFSPKDENIMKMSPKKELQLLQPRDKNFIYYSGLVGTILVISSFYLFSGKVSLGKTAAFSVLVFIQSFIFVEMWLSHQSFRKNYKKLKAKFFILAFIIPFIIQFMILKIVYLSEVFKVNPVTNVIYIYFVLIASLVYIIIRIFDNIVKAKSK